MFGLSSHGRCAGYVGNHRAVAYGARQYHAPSGAWHNPDRIAGNYPHLSPYAYCANNPLSIIDPSGDSLSIESNGDEYDIWYDKEGKIAFYDNNRRKYQPGNNDELDLTLQDFNTINSGIIGETLLSAIILNDKHIPIYITDINQFFPDTQSIEYNPYSTSIGVYENSLGNFSNDPYGNQFLNLGHELAHALDFLFDSLDESAWTEIIENTNSKAANSEKSACAVENLLRLEHGIPIRTDYLSPRSTNNNDFIRISKLDNSPQNLNRTLGILFRRALESKHKFTSR